MTHGLVSVVVPFRDHGQFLREAVESVLAQTYAEWELVFVDDGSTDASTQIAREYVHRFPQRVSYRKHPHGGTKGPPASRNRGIDASKGEFVAFLDADDVWVPDKLERQVDLMASHPEAGMVYGLSQWWFSWTGRAADRGRDFVHELGITPRVVMPPGSLLRPFFVTQEAAIPNPTSILVRRSVLEEVGGFTEDFSHVYEDKRSTRRCVCARR